MAKIVVLSMAYAGDVYPYAPIASELCRRGHDVTYVVPREFHESFAAEPFTCVHSGSDFSPRELDKHGEWLAKWGLRLGGARLLELYFGTFTVPYLDEQFDAIYNALDGADVLVSHSTAATVGAIAAEARDLPWISADLFPMLIPTKTRSPFANVPSLGPLNGLAWRLARSTKPERLTYAKAFADFRKSKNVDSRVRSAIDMRISPHLNLGMASPNYLPRAPDWPSNYHMTGFANWNNTSAELPDGLSEFLDAGPPPLLITLGTLAAASMPDRFDSIVAAADALDIRTLSLCSLESTAERLRSRHDPSMHQAWAFAPLSKVLPRVAAVAHSGSHGTNSMTLTAGLPSIVLPAIVDQLWHAKRQVELGTGIHLVTLNDLSDAIEHVLDDSAIRGKADTLGRQLRSEDGVIAAADQIDNYLAG